jgi:hypothetical protein
MAEFVRSLPEQLASELAKLAAEDNPNWWREILSNQDLHLAIREDYLNVYAKGQSVFKIELGKDKRPVMTTHYKYLLKPKMPPGKEYVTFDGRKFLMSGKPVDPSRLVQNSYVPNETIPELVRTATSYSNAEKSGVHIVANENSNVIDMEIAFSKVRDPEDPAKSDEADDDKRGRANSTALRIDLAALHPDGADKARLVFYEVKRFDDGRLWGSQPEVLNQIEQYDAFLESKEGKLKTAYKNVCKGLTELRQMKGTKPLSGLVGDVALERRKLVIEKACRLVVFGFDRDQQKGRLEQLKKALGLGDRMITRGSPKGLKLHPGDAP